MNDKDTVVVPRVLLTDLRQYIHRPPNDLAARITRLAAAPSTSVREEVSALVARLRAYRPVDEWGEGVRHTICDEAADALEGLAALKPSTDKGGDDADPA